MKVRELFANINLLWSGDFTAEIHNTTTNTRAEYTVKQLVENDNLYTEWKNLEVGCWSVIEKTFVITAM